MDSLLNEAQVFFVHLVFAKEKTCVYAHAHTHTHVYIIVYVHCTYIEEQQSVKLVLGQPWV